MERVFVKPLAIMRKYLGPFALQKCYKEMHDSTFYITNVVHRPQGLRNWVSSYLSTRTSVGELTMTQTEFAIQNEEEIPFEWLNNEQKVSEPN